MNARRSRTRSEAFAIDDTVASVTVLRLKTDNLAHIEEELRARLGAMPQRYPYAPVVVDVAELDAASAIELPLQDLADRLRACKLLPVGAANLPPSALWNAAAAGIAVVELGVPAAPAPSEPARLEPSPAPPAPAPSTVTVRQPVRSGQVIYAERADLVVLAPVNPGAQLIADGHIHVYGPLRGRALAGAKGRADACVFCQALEAELIAIAGQHLTADEIPPERRGRPSQIYVENGHVRMQPLYA